LLCPLWPLPSSATEASLHFIAYILYTTMNVCRATRHFIGLPNRECRQTATVPQWLTRGSRRRWLRLRFGLYSVADQLDSVLDELGMARHDDLEG